MDTCLTVTPTGFMNVISKGRIREEDIQRQGMMQVLVLTWKRGEILNPPKICFIRVTLPLFIIKFTRIIINLIINML
jgi:hypothetical protein